MRKEIKSVRGKDGQRLQVGDAVASSVGEHGKIAEIGLEYNGRRGTRPWVRLEGQSHQLGASRFSKVVAERA